MTNDQFEIETAEETLRAAMLASDIAALDMLIADDLIFIGPDGSVLAKNDDLAVHRSGEQQMTLLQVQEQCIRVSGNVGSVSVLAHVAGFFKGHAFDGRFRYLRVWHKTPSGWRVIAGSVFALH
jgi:ketosteroid isomerase-like protein